MDVDPTGQPGSVGPAMFTALHRWTLGLRDVGDLAGACSAAQSLCREARDDDEARTANQLLAELAELAGDVETVRLARERLVDLARWNLFYEPSAHQRVQLLNALDELGEVARRQADARTVLQCHGTHGRMEQLRALAVEYGLHPSLLTEQCYSLRRAGAAARTLGSYDEARALLEERLTVARLVTAGAPDEPRLVALVAAALSDLGSLLAEGSDPRAAHLLGEELQLRTWLGTDRTPPHGPGGRPGPVGADTEEHRLVTFDLLRRMEADGSLDVTGRMLLTSLRAG